MVPLFAYFLMQDYISISTCFPNHSPQQMSRFLQTPELWGSGPLLLLGVPRFQVHAGQHVFRSGDDKGVAFRMFNKDAVLISDRRGEHVDLRVQDTVHIRARVESFRPNNQGCYLSLLINDETPGRRLIAMSPEYIRSALHNFLWQGMETDFRAQTALEKFRENSL
jgi:hypothetical protein